MTTQIAVDKAGNGQFPEFNKASRSPSTPEKEVQPTSSELKVSELIEAEKQAVIEERKAAEQASVEKEQELDEAIEVISEFLNLSSKSVNFQLHDESEKTIIKVYDNDTKELIRQFPSDEVLEIAKRITELKEDIGRKTGILLDEKV